jgi:hypothetical protein
MFSGASANSTLPLQALDAMLAKHVQGLEANMRSEVQGLSTKVQGLTIQMTSVQGAVGHLGSEVSMMKSLVSIRDTSTAVADNILSSVQNVEIFEKMFDQCEADKIKKCWLQTANLRKKISSATDESHVQTVVVAVASKCCKNGQLAIHDTHKK